MTGDRSQQASSEGGATGRGDSQHGLGPAVIALAGRRIDAPRLAEPRFPLNAVPLVRERLAHLFFTERAEALVCSAACGSDLVALEEAERLGLRRRIILPFAPERFRETSVVDRPGDWGPAFDRLISVAAASGDLVVLAVAGGTDDAAYAAANAVIVRDATALARAARSPDEPRRMIAAIVWEGSPREGSDATSGLRDIAVRAGFVERSILTR